MEVAPAASSPVPPLTVVCLGDPLVSRTWSGTPANVCRELARRGALGPAIDSEAYFPRPLVLGTKVLSKLFYGGSRYVRLGRLERPLRARHVHACLERAGVAAGVDGPGVIQNVLHFNAHAFPFSPAELAAALPVTSSLSVSGRPKRRHLLLTDTTWALWRASCTDLHRISPRLIRDAERLEQCAYEQAAHIFSISDYVKRNLVEHYGVPPQHVTVIGTGRGAIRPYHGPKDYHARTVLFVAKERADDKGLGPLLAGFRLARRADPGLKLVLVGREDFRARVADEPGITVRGHVTLVELQALFEQASLFAMPAVNEPWGLVYLEALSCRVPVLGLRRHALPEITAEGRYGFCLETNAPEEIASALARAFSDPDRLAEMGAEGQKVCLERFTWERTVDTLLQAVARLPSV